MSTGLLEIVKRAAMDTIDNAQMCDIRTGEIVNVSPIRVQVTNNFILPQSVLIVPQSLTNHQVEVMINGETQIMAVNNALKVGDKVALLRKQGGQSYFILDRI